MTLKVSKGVYLKKVLEVTHYVQSVIMIQELGTEILRSWTHQGLNYPIMLLSLQSLPHFSDISFTSNKQIICMFLARIPRVREAQPELIRLF